MRLDNDAAAVGGRLKGDSVEASTSAERQRLERLASEFESSLLVQMLREMRRAGRWEETEGTTGMPGAQSLFEMLDVELASHMARVQGLGFTTQLLSAFDRVGAQPERGATPVVQGREVSQDVEADRVTSDFGWRRDPLTGAMKFHRGIDVAAAYGQDVPTVSGGTVVFSGAQGSFGTTVVVEHANGLRTRYAHLAATLVEVGDVVRSGEAVGLAGSSGRATGPHVHFELLDRNGTPLDPRAGLKLLDPDAD